MITIHHSYLSSHSIREASGRRQGHERWIGPRGRRALPVEAKLGVRVPIWGLTRSGLGLHQDTSFTWSVMFSTRFRAAGSVLALIWSLGLGLRLGCS